MSRSNLLTAHFTHIISRHWCISENQGHFLSLFNHDFTKSRVSLPFYRKIYFYVSEPKKCICFSIICVHKKSSRDNWITYNGEFPSFLLRCCGGLMMIILWAWYRQFKWMRRKLFYENFLRNFQFSFELLFPLMNETLNDEMKNRSKMFQ